MKANETRVHISTSSVKEENILDAIVKLAKITKNIELSGGHNYDGDLLAKLTKIKNQQCINFLIHCYFPPPKTHFILNFANRDKQTRNFIEESIKHVESLNVDYYSIHAGFKRDSELRNEQLHITGEERYNIWDIYSNIEWFKNRYPNIKLALENLYPINSIKEICFFSHINDIVDILEGAKDIFLLLDLGHLKVSSRILDFNFLDAIELLFKRYADRISEIHVSENQGKRDDHSLINSDSIQYMIIRKFKEKINKNNIRITMEIRNCTVKEIQKCYTLINNALL